MVDLLFDVDKIPSSKTCKTCKNKIFIQYYSGKKFWYCSVRKSGRTENGLLKIRLKNSACSFHKELNEHEMF